VIFFDAIGKIRTSKVFFCRSSDELKRQFRRSETVVVLKFDVPTPSLKYNHLIKNVQIVNINKNVLKLKFQIELDTTNQQINYVIQKALADAYTNFLEKLLVDCDYAKVKQTKKLIKSSLITEVKGAEMFHLCLEKKQSVKKTSLERLFSNCSNFFNLFSLKPTL
jgi:hypothetical protein